MQSGGQPDPMSHSNTASSGNGDISPDSNLALLKNLSSEKKQTKDGQPPKRRGPKPDSKPALTRRQELNRQAQRTHRERKEMYIKALEQEVLRLKEIFADTTRERDRVMEENTRLKALLAQHGISYDFGETPVKFQRSNSGYNPSSSGSISGSYAQVSESGGYSPSDLPNAPPMPMPNDQMRPPPADASMAHHQHHQQHQHHVSRANTAQLPSHHLDYDQIGIDFVLTLERPCIEHMQYLVVRSFNSDEQQFHHPAENSTDREYDHMSGHVMMATCPPLSHVLENPNEPHPWGMPDLGMPDLTKLLNLSARLPLNHDSEITPIMAWTQIYTDPRVRDLTAEDFDRMKKTLAPRVRCYGFGAVIESFEIADVLEAVFGEKGQDDGMLMAATNNVIAADAPVGMAFPQEIQVA